MVCLASMLCVLATADEAIRGRSLHEGKKSDSRSKYYTESFNVAANTTSDKEEFEGAYLYGVILGFIATVTAVFFGFSVIIYDEVKRHETFKFNVQSSKDKLTHHHGATPEDLILYDKEFAEKEATRGQTADAEKERLELAEIN